jgi:serine O-acetyltransferase
MKILALIRSDIRRYRKYGASLTTIIFLTQGFWASLQYRIAHMVWNFSRKNPFRWILMPIFQIWKKIIEILTGISIPASAKIGHSFYIGHFGGIIINANTIMGNHCNISQGVTIGVSGLAEKRGVPQIGNHVYIGANAVVAGKIVVGDHVLIAANSLVNRDAPDNAVMLGVPAEVVSLKGSEGYI